MLQPSHTTLRSPCSSGVNALTKRRCVRQSNALAALRTHAPWPWQRSRVECAGARVRDVNCLPTPTTRPDSSHPPKSSSTAHAFLSRVRELVWHRLDLVNQRREPELLKASPAYRPKYAFFCRLFSCPRHTRVAPFFCRLDALAVQDSGTGLTLATFSLANFLSQGIMNLTPSSIPTPVPIVGVDRFPRR